MVRADRLQQRVECRPVVHLLEVAELVEHHIILQIVRQQHQAEVEVYVPLGGAASPVAEIVLDADSIVAEPVLFCELF